jgi:hypothetical protein
MSKCPMARPDPHTTAYRRYLITRSFSYGLGFRVQRDGHHISYAPTIEAARAIIDDLTGEV